jgi:hypothetical protein
MIPLRRWLPVVALLAALLLPATGALAAAPTYVGQAQVSSWTTTTQGKTAALAVQLGDTLVAYGITETQSATITPSTPGLTWTKQTEVDASSKTHVYAWTSTAATTGTVTLTCTRSSTAKAYGCGIVAYRGTGGIGAAGASSSTNNVVTTLADNSALVYAVGDWAAKPNPTRTWGVAPLTATEMLYANSTAYTAYSARYADAGARGPKQTSLNAPTGMSGASVLVEVKGNTPNPPDTTPPNTTITQAAIGSATQTTTSTSASFSFISNESPALFDCRLDGGSWASCSPPKAYSNLAVGSHTFDVRARDSAGNIDATPATYTWTITGGTPTPTPTPTPTSTPTPTPTPPPGGCVAYPDPSACGYPDVDNTGPRIALTDARFAQLPAGAAWDAQSEVLRITANNVSLSGLDIPGAVTVDGNNFHLTDSKIHVDVGCSNYPCGNYGIRLGTTDAHVSGTVLSYDDIVVPANIGLPNATGATKVEFGVRNNGDTTAAMDHSYVAGYSDAWHAMGTITDSYLTGQLVQAGDHMEAFVNGGEGNPTILNHDTILTFKTNTGEAGSADVAIYNDFGPIARVDVTNSLLAGGQYLMEGGAKNGTGNVTGPITIRDNRISRAIWPNGGNLGLWTDFNAAATTSCRNVWDDTGAAVAGPPGSTC